MKTLTGKCKIWPALVIFVLILNAGCSKDRTEPVNEKSEYKENNEYCDSKKQQEQEVEITEDGNGPIIGKEGTKIYPDKSKLMFPNGDSVQYPYTVKLVELYTPKDMVYWQMPTVSDEKLLTSNGEVRIRAFKDGIELVLRPDATWTVELPSSNPKDGMQIFYGDKMEPVVNWSAIPSGEFTPTDYGYIGQIAKLGWAACSKYTPDPVSTVSLSFNSAYDELVNAGIFMYFPDLQGLIQVYNQQTIELPVGEQAKLIVFAVDNNNQLYSYYEELVTGDIQEISVELDSISDAELTGILDNL